MWYFCTPSVLELIYHRVRHLWGKRRRSRRRKRKTLSVYLFHSWVSLILYFKEERPLKDDPWHGASSQNSRNSGCSLEDDDTEKPHVTTNQCFEADGGTFYFLGYFQFLFFLHLFCFSFKLKGFGVANIKDESRFKSIFLFDYTFPYFYHVQPFYFETCYNLWCN